MLAAIKALVCRLRGHAWRRAHVGEAAGSMYCRRCSATRPVRHRTKAAA